MRLTDLQTEQEVRPATRRDQMAALAKYLHSGKDRDPATQAVLVLLGLLLEDAKDDLCRKSTTPQNFSVRQGEAFAYQELILAITTPPPPKQEY